MRRHSGDSSCLPVVAEEAALPGPGSDSAPEQEHVEGYDKKHAGGAAPSARSCVFPTHALSSCVVKFQVGDADPVLVRPMNVTELTVTCLAPPLRFTNASGLYAGSPRLLVSISFNGQDFEAPLAVGLAGMTTGQSFYHRTIYGRAVAKSFRVPSRGDLDGKLHASEDGKVHPSQLTRRLRPLPSFFTKLPVVQVTDTGSGRRSPDADEAMNEMRSTGPLMYLPPQIVSLSESAGSVLGGLIVIAKGSNLHGVDASTYVGVCVRACVRVCLCMSACMCVCVCARKHQLALTPSCHAAQLSSDLGRSLVHQWSTRW